MATTAAPQGYTYKGYSYTPYEDHEDDCTKIFHDVTHNGKVINHAIHVSPYHHLTIGEFHMWVDAQPA